MTLLSSLESVQIPGLHVLVPRLLGDAVLLAPGVVAVAWARELSGELRHGAELLTRAAALLLDLGVDLSKKFSH